VICLKRYSALVSESSQVLFYTLCANCSFFWGLHTSGDTKYNRRAKKKKRYTMRTKKGSAMDEREMNSGTHE